MPFYLIIECVIDEGKNDSLAKTIVDRLMCLPTDDKIWPNYMGKPIRHSSDSKMHMTLDVENYIAKFVKLIVMKESSGSKMDMTRSTSTKDKEKGVEEPMSVKSLGRLFMNSIVVYAVKEFDVSSGQQYAKGILFSTCYPVIFDSLIKHMLPSFCRV